MFIIGAGGVAEMTAECTEIGRMLGAMVRAPEKFLADF